MWQSRSPVSTMPHQTQLVAWIEALQLERSGAAGAPGQVRLGVQDRCTCKRRKQLRNWLRQDQLEIGVVDSGNPGASERLSCCRLRLGILGVCKVPLSLLD